jgi:hypothetical protein
VLTDAERLPRADFVAYGSLPEAEVAGRRLALARGILEAYSPRDLLPFLFRHGQASAAVALLYPLAPDNGHDRPSEDTSHPEGPSHVDPVQESGPPGPLGGLEAGDSDWQPITDR